MSRVQSCYNSSNKTCYLEYLKNNPDSFVTHAQYKDIIKGFHRNMMLYILETGDMVKIPFGFGDLSIQKWKPRRFVKDREGIEHINYPINWAETKKKGTYVYHINMHTDGYRFKWFWKRDNARFPVSDVYLFKPCRIFSRTLTKYLKDGQHYHFYKDYGVKKSKEY